MVIRESKPIECPNCNHTIVIPVFPELRPCAHLNDDGAVVFIPGMTEGDIIVLCRRCKEVK